MTKLASIFAAILGEAETIIPLFIHNPVSQKIEAIVVTTLDGALAAFGQAAASTNTAATPPTSPAA